MRLLNEADNRNGPCKTQTRVNALRTNCCIRENYVKDVIEMNEKKCCENTRASTKCSVSSPKLRSLSPIREDHSDSGEELQYGPGIVNKLRSKYMSMTLRDNGKKRLRPPLSNLRKASSLDNLLDDQMVDESKTYQISSVISCVNKLDYSSKESSSCVTVNFCADLKRTRSMEALLEEKSPSNIKSVVISQTKITNRASPTTTRGDDDINIPLDSIVNEDVIIVENLISEMKSKQEKRHRSSLESTELPPPDVVKETLKIFENCQKRPSPLKNWRQTKSESPKKPTVKPQLYPKPVLDNKVTIRTSEENSSADNGVRRDHTLLSSIKVNFESNKEPHHRTTLSHTTCIRNDINSINVNVKTSAVLANGAAAVNNDVVDCSPPRKPFRENGFVVIDKCVRNNCSATEADTKYRDILKPAAESLPPKQIGIIRPLVTAVIKPQLPVPSAETDASNLVGGQKTQFADKSDDDECPRKSINSKSNSSTEANVTTEQQMIQNFIGKPSTLLIKGTWNQQQNSMIFNFKDRKEVPDYIENDGLPLIVNRDRTKRFLSENGGTAGYIILGTDNMIEDPSAHESTTDSSYSCQETRTISRSPSPHNVHFRGDNVVIDGKSNLKKSPKEKNLRIQFNDTCTIFEYPSEASLLEEDSETDLKKDDEPSVAPVSSSSSNDSSNFLCENSRMHNPLNGGSGLASYVPSKLGVGMNESFELGVTKCGSAVASHSCSSKESSTSPSNRTTNDARSNGNGNGNPVDVVVDSYASDSALRRQSSENIANDYLKPAADGENIAWSEESIPDLLF